MQLSDRSMKRCAMLCVTGNVHKGCSCIESGGEFRGNRTSICWQTTLEVKGYEGGVIGTRSPVCSASCTGHAEKCNWREPKEGYLCRLSPCIKRPASVGCLHGERERNRKTKKAKEAILLQSTIYSRRIIFSLLCCNLGHKLITVCLFWCGILKWCKSFQGSWN